MGARLGALLFQSRTGFANFSISFMEKDMVK